MATDRDVELIRTRDCDSSVEAGEIANGVSREGTVEREFHPARTAEPQRSRSLTVFSVVISAVLIRRRLSH